MYSVTVKELGVASEDTYTYSNLTKSVKDGKLIFTLWDNPPLKERIRKILEATGYSFGVAEEIMAEIEKEKECPT